jgi:surface antigen
MLVALSHRPVFLLSAVALVAASATPAAAQFGGFSLPSLGRSAPSASGEPATTTNGCPKGKSKSAGAAVFGSIAGQFANRAAGRFSTWLPIPAVADTLTNAIACKLDPQEQKQASEATLEATRGDAAVGTTSAWTSSTRQNVSGKSTVTARNEIDASGLQCITVSDVIIVNGEESTANKRMCKPKGSARYSLMA